MTDQTSPLSGIDIGRIMSSTGPVVKCVILRAQSSIDPDRDVTSMSIGDMKKELEHYGLDTSSFVEKDELVKAVMAERADRTNKSLAEDSESTTAATTTEAEQEEEEKKEGITTEETPQDGPTKEVERPDTKVVPLTHLIEEIEVDTTPKKSMVSKVLGGDFTFLGQYEEERTMIMIRRPDWEKEGSTIPEEEIPPINPHSLQPPFDEIEVRGDILLIRVAETDEPFDSDGSDDDDVEEKGENDETVANAVDDVGVKETAELAELPSESAEKPPKTEVTVPTNEEFFLDYTRDEYLKFAARTDIVAMPIEKSPDECSESDEEENIAVESGTDIVNEQGELLGTQVNAEIDTKLNEHEEDDEHDADFDPDEIDEEDREDFESEEHQVGMMNLILGQILRKFHEENGRGPDTLELLEMRKALADRLGVEVPPVDEDACDWDKKIATPKRHNKKVVVAEEKNKSETIPRADEEDHDAYYNEDLGGLKRPAEAMENEENGEAEDEEGQSNKKVKLSEDEAHNDGRDS
eukprot:CAMPEP_0171328326 /NCGR_PEP_ID=MMETSP0878-20121228/585_1 /TAXON_ID=67004 /ORGANISM="Thalassiosira weissflogii, Strain CCMP1336" /LENGTH=522 /DNA_ID=CAMNT_0011828173 /DNA_START=64 /DNA_END=1632 /DNA_ORIENTATION=+